MRLSLWLITACAILICNQQTSAIDLYVDPVNGNDTNDGASWQTALKTMTRASQLENGPGRISLGEGVFSVESGEVFPVTFTSTTEIRGVAPDKTFIAVGNPAETIIWGNQRLSVATICDVTFYSTLSGETNYDGWEPFVISVGGGDPLEEILHIRRVRFVGFVSWAGELVLIRRHGSYYDSFRGDTRIEKCAFVDCKGTLLATDEEDYCYLGDVEIADCLIQPSHSGSSSYRAGLHIGYSCSLNLVDCVIRASQGRGAFSMLGVLWGYNIENCVLENIRVRLFPDCTLSDGRIVGCTFKDSLLYFNGYDAYNWPSTCDLNIIASLFDGSSDIEVKNGSLESKYSWVPNPPVIHPSGSYYGYLNISASDPCFAKGPLGGSYLADISSGQAQNSPLLGNIPEQYTWYSRADGEWHAWPPTGSTTRTDGIPDEAPYDIGCHYPSVPPPPPAVGVRTDKAEYAAGEEMQAFMFYENRGVKVEGAVYFAFAPESLDWFAYWPSMTFVPTPWVEGTLYSGLAFPNLPPTTHTIPEGLAPGAHFWLGAVISADGAFASDIAVWPVEITGD